MSSIRLSSTKSGGRKRDKGNDLNEKAEEDGEHETEVPGTCLPLLESNKKEENANHHQTVELAATKQSPPQHATIQNGLEDTAETPTINESQMSSIRLSSIKNVQKRDNGNDLNEEAMEETQVVPGTYLSPLRKTIRSRQCELRLCHSESPAKRNSPNQLSEALEENETEVPGTYLSPLRRKLDKSQYELKLCNDEPMSQRAEPLKRDRVDSSTHVERNMEENGTEVPGTYLSPLRKQMDKRQYELKLCNDESLYEQTESLKKGKVASSTHENETEVPGTYLSPLRRKRDKRQCELKLCNDESLSPQAGPLKIDRFDSSTHVERNGRFEPEFRQSYSTIMPSESEVPGTLVPPLVVNASTSQALVQSQFSGVHIGRQGYQKQCSVERPRRVSTSPDKVRQKKEAASKPEYPCSPSPAKKRPRVDHEPAAMQTRREAITTDIRPWNIHSEPIMSQLTCDVKTCPIGTTRPPDDNTQREAFTKNSVGNRNLSPEKKERPSTTTLQDRKQKLYVAYDVLDPVEIRALKMLHEQGLCQVVLDGVHSVSSHGHGESFDPFPAIMVTHTIDKPGFGSQKQSTVATCYRSYSYLKAKALGARIVDARWLVDCQNAGTLLDCDNYKIWSDLESYHNLMNAENLRDDAMATPCQESSMAHKFNGITFGLLQELGCNSPLELDESKSQSIKSLCLKTEPITTHEIESLTLCWGGSVTIDALTHMDILFVNDCMTLNQIAKGLLHNLKRNSDVRRWSIDKWRKDELEDFIVDGNLTSDCGEGIHVRIPIIRTKWLEDSICFNSLLSLTSYCWGILCL